ncbi:24339_t:CDS:2 [Gigaspora margarita]|uniref:24339_t:CDS:1 n=1 Tax=Gigaspora margarita TaxID=4874 RepID=A0ABM8W295_GIGMA|nr:24339_t:CDS:2 [Gigaspora margarita]
MAVYLVFFSFFCSYFEDGKAVYVEAVAVVNDIGGTVGDVEAAAGIDDVGSTFDVEAAATIDDIDDIGVFDLVGVASFDDVDVGAFDDVGVGAFENTINLMFLQGLLTYNTVLLSSSTLSLFTSV